MDTHTKLVMAVTEYDRHEEKMALKNKRRYHNPYALAHYLGAVQSIQELVDQGATWEDAIKECTLGRLQVACLKAIAK